MRKIPYWLEPTALAIFVFMLQAAAMAAMVYGISWWLTAIFKQACP